MNDQLKLNNGQVVDAVFLGLDSEGTGQYGNWFKYSLKVDGKEMIYFANDNQKPIFDNLKRDEAFKFGKIKKNAKGTYHKVERVASDTPATTTTTTNNSTTSNDTRTFSQREASIVAGVAVKVAGWSIAPVLY